jgi:hypothetical protein
MRELPHWPTPLVRSARCRACAGLRVARVSRVAVSDRAAGSRLKTSQCPASVCCDPSDDCARKDDDREREGDEECHERAMLVSMAVLMVEGRDARTARGALASTVRADARQSTATDEDAHDSFGGMTLNPGEFSKVATRRRFAVNGPSGREYAS